MVKLQISRRQAAKWAMALCLVPGVLRAEGGGGGNADPSDNKKPTSRAKSSGTHQFDVLPVDSFLRMSAEELLLAGAAAGKKGQTLVIDGFMPKMTQPLRKMMEIDPRSTRRLVRDMRGKTTEKARKQRLASERTKQERRVKVYVDSIHQRRGDNSDTARENNAEDRKRVRQTRGYLKQLQKWERDPMQGTY